MKKIGQARCMEVYYEVLSVKVGGQYKVVNIFGKTKADMLYAISDKI